MHKVLKDGAIVQVSAEAFGPLPPTLITHTRLPKAELWRRLEEGEPELLAAALNAAPVQQRMIYEAATYLDTTDPHYPALRAGIVEALGEPRANVVLAPVY